MPHRTPHTNGVPPPPRTRQAAGQHAEILRGYAIAMGSMWHLSNTSRLTTLSESVCRGRAVARTTGRERHRVNWTRALTGVRAPTPATA